MYSQSLDVVLLLQAVLERGQVRVGDEVEIVGITDKLLKTTVTGVEMFRKIVRLC